MRNFPQPHLILFVIGMSYFAVLAQAPVVVTADHPNVWTLEQAHYLLAQMHRRNLDLKAAELKDLDANEINATRLDALRTLLDISAEYDEAVALKNRNLGREREFNFNRRQQLASDRDRLNGEAVELAKRIAELKIARTQSDDEDEQKELDQQIKELELVKAVVDEQIKQKNAELASLATVPDSESVSPDRASTTNRQSAAYDSALAEAVKEITSQFSASPQLNASLRLDNYLQMQYEILSKQLTLLRDEVGAGERLIFLEMPQSVNTTFDKADNKWVQTRWKVAAFSRCVAYKDDRISLPCSKVFNKYDEAGERPRYTTEEIIRGLDVKQSQPSKGDENFGVSISDFGMHSRGGPNSILSLVSGGPPSDGLFRDSFRREMELKLGRQLIEYDAAQKALTDCYSTSAALSSTERYDLCKPRADIAGGLRRDLEASIVAEVNDFVKNSPAGIRVSSWADVSDRVSQLSKSLPQTSGLFRRVVLHDAFGVRMPSAFSQELKELGEIDLGNRLGKAPNRTVRVIDIFPKQSSLNVNELKMKSHAFSFKFLLKLLGGFGSNVNYERTRERYSQFVQQELYSSGFGKGAVEFGWTFNPMPGTKRVLSGTKTTFAILVVPEDATAVVLNARGAYFTRSSIQPNGIGDTDWLQGHTADKRGWASDTQTFVVAIPDGGSSNNISPEVSEVRYRSVEKGKRIVLAINGNNFTSQTGILVNGVPLTPALGVGQPYIRDDSKVAQLAKTDLPKGEVDGQFERLDSQQIVATFRMDEKFEGTPTITLIAPGKAEEITSSNRINVFDSDTGIAKRWSQASFMFGYRFQSADPFRSDSGIRIEKVNLFKAPDFDSKRGLVATVLGSGLNNISSFILNGTPSTSPSITYTQTDSVVNIQFTSPLEKGISLVFTTNWNDSIVVGPYENPGQPQAPQKAFAVNTDFRVIDYQKDASGKEIAIVLITGVGLDKLRQPNRGSVEIISATEALLKIGKDSLPDVITFESSEANTKPEKLIVVNKVVEKPKESGKQEAPKS